MGFCSLFFLAVQVAAIPTVATIDDPARPTPLAGSIASAVPTSASDLLQQGFGALTGHRETQAIASLNAALSTGDLNDAGRSLAYWYLFVAWQRLAKENQSADALLSFVTVSNDLLSDAADDESPTADAFVERFDLRHRVARARATLSAVWAAKAFAFGRHSNLPVPVHSALEEDYFLHLMVPCDEKLRVSDQRTGGAPVVRVTVECQGSVGAAGQHQFYFERSEAL